MAEHTPGQRAYAAYLAAYGHPAWMPTWTDLLALNHRAWEAAAQAVSALAHPQAPLHHPLEAIGWVYPPRQEEDHHA